MLTPDVPAVILAPMDGITDAPMRALQGEIGAFAFAVSEFLRVSQEVPPAKAFYRHIPELCAGSVTPTGLPVQVQILGGDAGRMAAAAVVAYQAGARMIDINFGCPAPTVNRHDGGATLLKYPPRIREVVGAVRAALPSEVAVSAKMRLGWDTLDAVYANAEMAAEGGAAWITIHGRTRVAGYTPPAYWRPIGMVRERVGIPVVANGDIWTIEEFRRCREESGCLHYMLGRSALANPSLSHQIAHELGIPCGAIPPKPQMPADWLPYLRRLVAFTQLYEDRVPQRTVHRLKQWLRFAATHGDFTAFDSIKRAETVEELFAVLTQAT